MMGKKMFLLKYNILLPLMAAIAAWYSSTNMLQSAQIDGSLLTSLVDAPLPIVVTISVFWLFFRLLGHLSIRDDKMVEQSRSDRKEMREIMATEMAEVKKEVESVSERLQSLSELNAVISENSHAVREMSLAIERLRVDLNK